MQGTIGWLVSFIERRNPHLGSISRASFYGLMSFLNAADNKPETRLGRTLTIVWLMANVISLSIITCVARWRSARAVACWNGGMLARPSPRRSARATACWRAHAAPRHARALLVRAGPSSAPS